MKVGFSMNPEGDHNIFGKNTGKLQYLMNEGLVNWTILYFFITHQDL